MNGQRSIYVILKSDLLVSIQTKSNQISFQAYWFICVTNQLSDGILIRSATNLKLHTNLSSNPNSLLA